MAAIILFSVFIFFNIKKESPTVFEVVLWNDKSTANQNPFIWLPLYIYLKIYILNKSPTLFKVNHTRTYTRKRHLTCLCHMSQATVTLLESLKLLCTDTAKESNTAKENNIMLNKFCKRTKLEGTHLEFDSGLRVYKVPPFCSSRKPFISTD